MTNPATKFKYDSFLDSLEAVYRDANLKNIVSNCMDWNEEKFEAVYLKSKSQDRNIKEYIFDNYHKMGENSQDTLEFFKKYLTPSKDEVKLFGEVFTPISLIEEMLNKFPKEIWSNKNLKWLDPANGIGNFPIIIFQRLMEGLADVIIDKAERKKHILEEMLYMVDISSKNTFICMNIFDPNDEYNLNIHRGDFLTANLEEIFNVTKFDIIVGNPPFNPPNLNQGGTGSKNKIWHKFIEKGFSILEERNGLFSFITPKNWRISNLKKGVERKAQALMWNKNILNIVECDSHFKGSAGNVSIDYWVISNNMNLKGLDIPASLRKINFYPLEFRDEIATFYEEIEKTECYRLTYRDNRYYDYTYIKGVEGDEISIYPHLNTIAQYQKNVVEWLDKKTKGFDDKKVIISDSVNMNTPGMFFAVYNGGGLGCGSHSKAFRVDDEKSGKKLEHFINNSSLIKKILREGSNKTGFGLAMFLIHNIPKHIVNTYDLQ